MRKQIAKTTLIICIFLQGLSWAGINDGLVGYWPFDEGSGSKAYDTANSYDGTIVGAQWTSGAVGGALEFDGVNDYVSLPDNASVWVPTGNFTMSLWVYYHNDPGETLESLFRLDCHSSDSYATYNQGVGITSNIAYGDKLVFRLTTSTYSTDLLTSNQSLKKSTWYHIVAVRNGTSQKIYINGQLDASQTCAAENIIYTGGYNSDKVRIGASAKNNTGTPIFFFAGLIDEVRLYDRALSSSEITTLASTSETPKQYQVKLSCTEGGTITSPGEGTFTYEAGTQIQLLAEAESGYTFKGWSGNLWSTRNPLSLTVTGNYSIKAIFEPILHSLTVSTTTGGIILQPANPSGSYLEGSTVRVQAQTKDSTFTFTGWQGSAVDAGCVANPDSLCTSVTLNEDHTMMATFVSLLDTLYVDDDASDDPDKNGTAEHPFDSIQEAISLSVDGACIVVNTGTYEETLDFGGRQITVTSEDVNTPGVYAFPTIDANGTGPVVRFTQGEDANSVLTGFILTGGYSDQAAAIECRQSSPSLSHLLITGNRCYESLDDSDSQQAVIVLEDSNSVMSHLTLHGNYTPSGPSLRLTDCNAVLVNSILWDQLDLDIQIDSGNNPAITYCNLLQAWAGSGNQTLDPEFYLPGYWADSQNTAIALSPSEPDAIWVAGDYHLMSEFGRWDPYTGNWSLDLYPIATTSFCIDAGSPFESTGGEIEPNGRRVNMGVYGGTQEASLSGY